jgi:glycosyltransferase involved in cell wall biosynthesis
MVVTNSGSINIAAKIAIATTTFYRPDSESDKYRAELAGKLVARSVELGHEIIVVDGGSSEELLRSFERFGARVYLQTSKSMGAGRRQAIKEAQDTGREVIAWTEPEKAGYIDDIVKTAEPILAGAADLIVPRRKEMYSYPTAQQNAEPLGNSFWKALTGRDLDVWFGSRTWRRDVSDYFLDYCGEYGDKWDSIFIPVLDMILDGKRVGEVQVDYTHPPKQREIEDRTLDFYWKRIEQLTNLMGALEKHWCSRA